jgi:hypothetical protein
VVGTEGESRATICCSKLHSFQKKKKMKKKKKKKKKRKKKKMKKKMKKN